MLNSRLSILASLLTTGLILALLAGCSAGNPNVTAAEDALEELRHRYARGELSDENFYGVDSLPSFDT